MATIDSTYFQGPLYVAQKDEAAISLNLNNLIKVHEEKFLDYLMGYELAKQYKTGIIGDNPDVKWTRIRDGVEFTDEEFNELTKWPGLKFKADGIDRSPIANYVYTEYMRSIHTATTPGGEKKLDATNAKEANPAYKVSEAWNEMVEWNRLFRKYMIQNITTYDKYVDPFGVSFFTPQNTKRQELLRTVNRFF